MMILKTSWDYKTIDGTLEEFIDLEIEEELYGGGTMSFTVFADTDFSLFSEFKKVELFAVQGGEDKSVFRGYVSQIQYDFDKVHIECRNEKMWLRNKICYAQISNKPPVEILAQLVLDANNRMPSHEMPLSFSTILTESKGIKIEKGTTYYDALDDMADLWGCEWTCRYGKIIFGEIGIIRDDQFLLIIDSDNTGSILSVDYTRDTVDIANAILGSNDGNHLEKEEVSYLPRIEKFLPLETGTEDEITELLEEKKSPRRDVKIEPNTDNIFLECGDSVQVDIEHGNPLFDFSEQVKIQSKKIDFSEGYPKISLEVSNVLRKIETPENFLRKIQRNI